MGKITFNADQDVHDAIRDIKRKEGRYDYHIINSALRDQLVKKEKPKPEKSGLILPDPPYICEIREHLNNVTGRKFKNIDAVIPRLKEGHTSEEVKLVIDYKAREWMGTKDQKYLRPETLFRSSKFEGYLNDARQGVTHERNERSTKQPKLSPIERVQAGIDREHQEAMAPYDGDIRPTMDIQLRGEGRPTESMDGIAERIDREASC